MGMSIDKAINNLNGILTEATEGENSVCYVTENDAETLQVAIETMRKYQTMQEVLDKVWNVPSCMLDEAECLNEIMETYRTVRW